MRWWWQPKPEESIATLSASEPVDLASLAREAGREVVREMLPEIARTLVTNAPGGPLPPVPDPNKKPPYQAYAYDRPYDFYTPQAPTRRPRSVVSVETLRLLADNYDILRSAILHLKREVQRVPIEVVAKDPKAKGQAMEARQKEAQWLFSTSGPVGGKTRRRTHFENSIFEDALVIGNWAILHTATLGGGLYESVDLDAATIRPRVDAYGWPDQNVPYEQWIYGVQVAQFEPGEISFDGLWPVSYTPYFKSPVEYLITTVNAALRADNWNLSWLTDGNTPADIVQLPEEWTPEQVQTFATWWDTLLTGDSSQRQKTRFVPGKTQRLGTMAGKDQDFKEYELWLMQRVCAIFGVTPASIGFEGRQYKVAQEGSQKQTAIVGAGQLLEMRKALYDDILERAGYGDFEAQNVDSKDESAKDRADTGAVLIQSGQRTPNEVRQAEGMDPIEGGDTLFVLNTLTPLDQAIAPPEPMPVPGGPNPGGTPPSATDPPAGGDPPPAKRIARKGAPKTLQGATEDFRAALLSRQDEAVTAVASAYGVAEATIRGEWDALIARMTEAQANGETIIPAWLDSDARYRALIAAIEEAHRTLADEVTPAVSDAQADMVGDATRSAQTLAEAAAGAAPANVGITWAALPTAAIDNLIGFASDGSPLSDLFDAIGPDMAVNARNALVASLAAGEGAADTARRLDGVLNVGRARATNIARTETMRASREASRQSYEANADVVTGWRWVSAMTTRTCAACWAMQGTLHTNDETLDGHQQCRCVMVPATRSWAEITGDDSIPDTRPEIADGTEAFGRMTEGQQREVLGPSLYGLMSEGRITLSDCVVRESDPRWGTMRRAATVDEALANAQAAQRVELARWERKATNRFKSGRGARCDFESDRIPLDMKTRIYIALGGCPSVDLIKAVFRQGVSDANN